VNEQAPDQETEAGEPSRRDFIYIATLGTAGIGGALTLWPFIDQMNPAADTLALASIRTSIADIVEGEQVTVMWRGGPVFIRHRTAAEVEAAVAVEMSDLPDRDARNENTGSAPATDANRSAMTAGVRDGVEVSDETRRKFIIMKANCTHLGCVPVGESGEYDGWFCPCHGSHYDSSGRIRRGPAPENLHVPPYEFVSSTTIQIG